MAARTSAWAWSLHGRRLVESFLAGGPLTEKDPCPLIVGLCEHEIRLSHFESRFGLSVSGAVGFRVDLEQQVAFLDLRPFDRGLLRR